MNEFTIEIMPLAFPIQRNALADALVLLSMMSMSYHSGLSTTTEEYNPISPSTVLILWSSMTAVFNATNEYLTNAYTRGLEIPFTVRPKMSAQMMTNHLSKNYTKMMKNLLKNYPTLTILTFTIPSLVPR